MNSSSPNVNYNLSSLPTQFHGFQQEQSFVQSMGMEMGQEMNSFSFQCSSSDPIFNTTNNNINTNVINNTNINNTNNNGNLVMNPIVLSQPFTSLSITSLLDKQRREVELYLHFQGERMKEALHQQKKQQMTLLLNNYQSRVVALLKEKEEELEIYKTKTNMLEQFLKRKQEETGIWQRICKEKEEMITELNTMLLLIKQNVPHLNNNRGENDGVDDVESVCECESININARRSHDQGGKKMGYCKWCNSKEMSVVFLPCKHLCCCNECEYALEFCPICQSLKEGSMEIAFS